MAERIIKVMEHYFKGDFPNMALLPLNYFMTKISIILHNAYINCNVKLNDWLYAHVFGLKLR